MAHVPVERMLLALGLINGIIALLTGLLGLGFMLGL